MGAFQKDGSEIHIFANKWAETEGIVFHRTPAVSLNSFLSTTTFNRNVCEAVRNEWQRDCVISLERTTCQDIYRAGEGCHAEWLAIRSEAEPAYKVLSFRMNPLHRALLSIEKQLFLETGLIVANSNMVKTQIKKHYAVPDERISVIYNGVDTARFAPSNREQWRGPARRELAIPDKTKTVLFVGTGFERKGLNTLINAISLIKKENIKAVIVGKGNIDKYRRMAAKQGAADKIIFMGPQKDIEKFYSCADIFVLPTLYDPFSNATLEAMASGLPVITTRNNGAAELVENSREGFIMKGHRDVKDLADKIMICAENISIMGKLARDRAEKFPIGDAVQKFKGLIEEVGKNKKQKS